MIAVIADDLSGAAEIAGIALRFKLSVEIAFTVNENTTADVLIISTDTRSMDAVTAIKITQSIVSDLIKLKPNLIYKKIDSVLRGHVLAEIKTQLAICKNRGVLIVPANPSMARTIVNGHYYIQGIPIHHTGFANDPEFAISNSLVKTLLHNANDAIVLCNLADGIPLSGIAIAEAASMLDMYAWAKLSIDRQLMLVGAGDFFQAILLEKYVDTKISINNDIDIDEKSNQLLVVGTNFANRVKNIKIISEQTELVVYMLDSIFTTDQIDLLEIQKWSNEIIAKIQAGGFAIMAIKNNTAITVNPKILRQKMAIAVKMITDQIHLSKIFIEGGSTAAAIIAALDIHQLLPVIELKRGVIAMDVPTKIPLQIIIKPGSYPWADGQFDSLMSKSAVL
jgi:uncharacterized protein YgbK (DUF1537 family)